MKRWSLSSLGGLSSAVALACAACSSTINTPSPLPGPTNGPAASPIQHVVILFQENRSFNMMFMNYPGAETSTTGKCKEFHPPGSPVLCPKDLPQKLQGIHLNDGIDIEHGHRAFEVEYDNGKMDGFDELHGGTTGGSSWAGTYPYAYVVRSDVQPYWDMANQYALADHMFTTATTDSFVAHQEIIAATTRLTAHESITDVPSNRPWGCDAPPGTTTHVLFTNGIERYDGPFPCFTQWKTMADVLDAAGVGWKYYVQSWDMNSPYFEFSGQVWDGYDAIKHVRYGPDWKNIVNPYNRVLKDIASNKLPQVTWVIPKVADSDHPASGDNKGPSWVSSVVNAIGQSKYWNNTAVIVMWDDWGGWYDPVPPPQLDYTSLGMRVPMIVISPYAKAHYVSKTQYEFGSVLKFIEQNFGTASLGTTDARANSIGDVFNFKQKPIAFKPIKAPYPETFFLQPRPSSSGWTHSDDFGD